MILYVYPDSQLCFEFQVGFASPYSLMKFVFPLLILMTGMDISWDQVVSVCRDDKFKQYTMYNISIIYKVA